MVKNKLSTSIEDLKPEDFNGAWANYDSTVILSALLGNDFAVHTLSIDNDVQVARKRNRCSNRCPNNLTTSHLTWVNFACPNTGCVPTPDDNDKTLIHTNVRSLDEMLQYRRQMRGTLCHMFFLYVNHNHYDFLVPASIQHERFRALRQPDQSDSTANDATKNEILCAEQYFAGNQPKTSVQYNLPPVGAQKIVPAKTLLQYAGPTELEFPVYERKLQIVDDDEVVCIPKNTKNKKRKKKLVCIDSTEHKNTKNKREKSLCVQPSNIEDGGKGLFTNECIESNSFICDYGGVFYTDKQFEEELSLLEQQYGVRITTDCIVSAHRERRALGRYANTCLNNNNAKLVVNTRTRTVSIHSTKRIEKGEEIYVPYGKGFYNKFIRNRDKTFKTFSEVNKMF